MTDKEKHTNSQEYKPLEVSSEENDFFYSSSELDRKAGCIGHLRMDFGRRGNEFWSTWSDHCPEIKTDNFKAELSDLIDSFRENGILKDLSAMRKHCNENPQAKLAGGQDNYYGFKVKTDNHVYYLRCSTIQGDYNLYCYTYERSRLEKHLSPEKSTLAGKLKENKQKAAKQKKTATHKNNDLEV